MVEISLKRFKYHKFVTCHFNKKLINILTNKQNQNNYKIEIILKKLKGDRPPPIGWPDHPASLGVV